MTTTTSELADHSLPPATTARDELVRRIVAVLDDRPYGLVEVAGDPELADQLRGILGLRVTKDEVTAPTAIVDATGSPHVIRSALRRLTDHGMLIMTAELRGGGGQLNYYEDLHLRSLTVMGV